MLSLHGSLEGSEEMMEGSTSLKSDAGTLAYASKRRQWWKGRQTALQGSSLSGHQACQQELAEPSCSGENITELGWNGCGCLTGWSGRLAWADSLRGTRREETTEEKRGK